jgi:hypothetical protein
MDHRGETIALLNERIVDVSAISRGANGANPVHELDGVRQMAQYRAVIAKKRGSQQGRKIEIQINESENVAPAQEKCAHQHFGVTASSDYDDRQFECAHRELQQVVPV